MRLLGLILVFTVILVPSISWSEDPPLPRFSAPGFEKQISSIDALFRLHYPGSNPKATMWEEWLSLCSLWPATEQLQSMRDQWSQAISSRTMEADGYVATHQHGSIAHQTGWPFPFWKQSQGTWGWHFNLPPIDKGWHGVEARDEKGWKWEGLESKGVTDGCWTLAIQSNDAAVVAPTLEFDSYCAPFLQLRWKAKGLGNAAPYVEWVNTPTEEFTSEKRMHFDPVESDSLVYTHIPVYRHPLWTGRIHGLRIGFDPQGAQATVGIDSFFTTFDTRHDINNSSFLLGADNYFRWSGDVNFLRSQIERFRKALLYILTEFQLASRHLVVCPWVGHEGRAGYTVLPDGKKEMHWGNGIGSNYWDLLPIGHLDPYATNQAYLALRKMAALEEAIELHPEWNIPASGLKMDPEYLLDLSEKVREEYQKTFWNPETGRFVFLDSNGERHDYGFTFLNLEAIYYGLASKEQAESILAWLDGKRVVEGDTSTGADIYHWRFAPRATTKRNVEWYFWAWTGPESIPWGYQIQDGGAVLGFSYFDILSRLAVLGPDNAWDRLMTIAEWFGEVRAEGGYRKYYDGSKPERGSLQGGGTPGGLGLDHEFFESAMVPQTLLYGFLGFQPATDGFSIIPDLPKALPSLAIEGIAWHDLVLDVSVAPDRIMVGYRGDEDSPVTILLPEGQWSLAHKDSSGQVLPGGAPEAKGNAWVLRLADAGRLEFRKEKP